VTQGSFSITPIAPFRLDLTAWALRRRPENAVDRWDGRTYRRVLMIDSQAVEVAVDQSSGQEAPQLEVDVTGSRLTVGQEECRGERLRGLSGLACRRVSGYLCAVVTALEILVKFATAKPPNISDLA
jgi:hypothetical protein